MDADSVINLVKECNNQIPLLISTISWWKNLAIVFIIMTIIEMVYIIYIKLNINEKPNKNNE